MHSKSCLTRFDQSFANLDQEAVYKQNLTLPTGQICDRIALYDYNLGIIICVTYSNLFSTTDTDVYLLLITTQLS